MADLDSFRSALAWLRQQDGAEAAYLAERLGHWISRGGTLEAHLFTDRRPGERLPEHQLASDAKDQLLATAYACVRAAGATQGQFLLRLSLFRRDRWEPPPRARPVVYLDPVDALLSDALDASTRCGGGLPTTRQALHKLLARAERQPSSGPVADAPAA